MAARFSRTRAAGNGPTSDERLADVLELHEAHPGITEATLGACTMADGRTAYELLAAEVRGGDRVVLDLGCGNGALLDAVARLRPGAWTLLGVDLCASDLSLARARLPPDRAQLHCAPATRLPLDDDSVCAVLSHHAFYLFEPIEAALAEVARVLRPGGVFACVTWSFAGAGTQPFAGMMHAMSEITQRAYPAFSGWADRRSFDHAALERLQKQAGLPWPLEVEEHTLVLHEPADRIIARLQGFFYTAHLHREDTRTELSAAWSRLLARTVDAQGRARLAFPFSLTRTRTPRCDPDRV